MANKKVDAETLDQLEDFLIESDVGVIAAKELKQIFSNATIDPSKNSIGQINSLVETYIKNLMFPLEKEIIFEIESEPNEFSAVTVVRKSPKIVITNTTSITTLVGPSS